MRTIQLPDHGAAVRRAQTLRIADASVEAAQNAGTRSRVIDAEVETALSRVATNRARPERRLALRSLQDFLA